MSDGLGDRFNEGKSRMDLIPWDTMLALGHHYSMGALKYSDRNWEKGLHWADTAAALQRHHAAWACGEDTFTETISGEPITTYHDMAMVWNAVAIATYRIRGVGVDNRSKLIQVKMP